MKKTTCLSFALILVVVWVSGYHAIAQEKPNIIYFLVDNLGLGELGCYDGGLTRGEGAFNKIRRTD